MLLRPASAWIWERASTAGPRRAREHETIRDSLARGRVVIMRGHCPGLVSHVVALAILVSHCTPTSVSTSVSALGKLCSPGPPRAQGGVQDVFVRVLAAHNSSIGPCAALTRQFEPGSRGSAQMRLRGGWGLSWVRSSRGAGDANNDAGSDADGVQPRKYGSTPSPPRQGDEESAASDPESSTRGDCEDSEEERHEGAAAVARRLAGGRVGALRRAVKRAWVQVGGSALLGGEGSLEVDRRLWAAASAGEMEAVFAAAEEGARVNACLADLVRPRPRPKRIPPPARPRRRGRRRARTSALRTAGRGARRCTRRRSAATPRPPAPSPPSVQTSMLRCAARARARARAPERG
jgi:hypothetical protein